MDKQVLFLFGALNGFLDWMPVELVSVFEEEFYIYYSGAICNYPFKNSLIAKKNEFDREIVSYFIWFFTESFILFSAKYYNYAA